MSDVLMVALLVAGTAGCWGFALACQVLLRS